MGWFDVVGKCLGSLTTLACEPLAGLFPVLVSRRGSAVSESDVSGVSYTSDREQGYERQHTSAN